MNKNERLVAIGFALVSTAISLRVMKIWELRSESKRIKAKIESDIKWNEYHEQLAGLIDHLDQKLETARFWELVTREEDI